MRLRPQQESKIPSVNLIPMLNVMLGVLAFFVMITMTLGTQRGVEVQLPADSNTPPAEPTEEDPPPPLIVTLNQQRQIVVDDTPMTQSQLTQRIQEHLAQSDDSLVYLTADRQIPYQEVLQFLLDMKEVGGDRVSLAIEETSSP